MLKEERTVNRPIGQINLDWIEVNSKRVQITSVTLSICHSVSYSSKAGEQTKIINLLLVYNAHQTRDQNPDQFIVETDGIGHYDRLPLCPAATTKQKQYKNWISPLKTIRKPSKDPQQLHYFLGQTVLFLNGTIIEQRWKSLEIWKSSTIESNFNGHWNICTIIWIEIEKIDRIGSICQQMCVEQINHVAAECKMKTIKSPLRFRGSQPYLLATINRNGRQMTVDSSNLSPYLHLPTFHFQLNKESKLLNKIIISN